MFIDQHALEQRRQGLACGVLCKQVCEEAQRNLANSLVCQQRVDDALAELARPQHHSLVLERPTGHVSNTIRDVLLSS